MALPTGFEPTDEWAKGHLGMSLADYYAKNPNAQLEYQNRQSGNSSGGFDPIKTAQQAQQMQIQANQPAIQTLNNQKTDLDSRYSDLINSIKGQQQTAENSQITATNNELARRGISSDSGLGQQQMASSLRPLDAQYQNLTAQAGLSRQQDLTGLASQIASLQAGNVPSSLNFANGVQGLQNQAQEIANNYNVQMNPNYIPLPGVGIYDTAQKSLINQLNGGLGGSGAGIQVINGVPYINQ